MYAEWRGGVYLASDVVGTPRMVRLWTEDPTRTRGGFEEIIPGRFARLVPESDLTALFDLVTYCMWKDRRCRVTGRSLEGLLQLDWAGGSQAKAAELGFQVVERGVFVTAVPPLEVTDLHQERRTIPLD